MGEPKKSRRYADPSDHVDPKHRSSKDTKRWCRGKIGVEHDKQWLEVQEGFLRKRYALPYNEVFICTRCNREFERRRKVWKFGEIVHRVRVSRAITRIELAAACNVSSEYIVRLEEDAVSPSLAMVQLFCAALDLECVLDVYDAGPVIIHKRIRS